MSPKASRKPTVAATSWPWFADALVLLNDRSIAVHGRVRVPKTPILNQVAEKPDEAVLEVASLEQANGGRHEVPGEA